MMTVIEAVYENGVLKPLAAAALEEHQRYRLIVQEAALPTVEELLADNPELAAEIERRTTILPDGRKITRLEGLFEADLSGIPDDVDPIAEAIAEIRRERAAHFDEKWPPLPKS